MPSIEQIKVGIEPIALKYGIKRVFLFGSYAKGTANEKSDVDLLIEKGLPLSLLNLVAIQQEAKESLGLDVDIVSLAGVGADFQDEIKGTEVLIYEA